MYTAHANNKGELITINNLSLAEAYAMVMECQSECWVVRVQDAATIIHHPAVK